MAIGLYLLLVINFSLNGRRLAIGTIISVPWYCCTTACDDTNSPTQLFRLEGLCIENIVSLVNFEVIIQARQDIAASF